MRPSRWSRSTSRQQRETLAGDAGMTLKTGHGFAKKIRFQRG